MLFLKRKGESMCIMGFDTGVETNNTIIRMTPYKLLYSTYQSGPHCSTHDDLTHKLLSFRFEPELQLILTITVTIIV